MSLPSTTTNWMKHARQKYMHDRFNDWTRSTAHCSADRRWWFASAAIIGMCWIDVKRVNAESARLHSKTSKKSRSMACMRCSSANANRLALLMTAKQSLVCQCENNCSALFDGFEAISGHKYLGTAREWKKGPNHSAVYTAKEYLACVLSEHGLRV